jgi:amino acid adenylation domain-containing protein
VKILLVQNMLYVPTLGGANKLTRLLVEGLAQHNHLCRVVAPAVGGHGLKTRDEFLAALAERAIAHISSNGADVFHHRDVEIHATRDAAQLRACVVEQIREFKPDWVIVASQDPGQILLSAALEEGRGRVVYLVQAPWDLSFGPHAIFTSQAATELVRQTAGIVTVSNYLKDYIRRWSDMDSTVVHCPVYGEGPFPYLGAFDNEFITLVNPSAIKGLSIFLELARRFPHERFAAVPTWATNAADRLEMERLPNVTMLEAVDDIDEIFARTRVLLVPSLWDEAFGLINVEAMLRGIPVLASNVGGVPEAKLGVDYVLPVRPIERYEERFDERNNPVPVVPAQDIGPWEEALQKLINDREQYAQLSNASRQTALDFVSRTGIAPFEDLLSNLIPQSRPQPPDLQTQSNAVAAAASSAQLDVLSNLSPQKRSLLALRALQRKKKSPDSSTPKSIPRRSDATPNPPPLSFAQQRLWFLDQLEPGNTAYHLPTSVRLRGPLDTGALERTFIEIIRRHEVLRTTFSVVEGEPVQLISEDLPKELPVLSLVDLPTEERETEMRRLAAEESRRPFDLSKGPLLRMSLLKLGEEDYALLLTMHHIISDGWSIGVLIREVATLYEAFAKGSRSPLPELSIQYADFACWQREWLRAEELERQLSYWREQLTGAPPVLEMPTDRTRPPAPSHLGARCSIALTKSLSDALRELCQSEGVTPFMLLLATFQTLLSRYTGQEDISVGSPIAGRTRAEIEPLIGFFINTLVLRTDLSGNPSFRELLQRVKTIALGAYGHQDVPFEKLVEELQPERDMGRHPLFQVMFVMQNAPREQMGIPGVELSYIGAQRETTNFDLTLTITGTDELAASISYSVDLFDEATISRLLSHFHRLLHSIIADASLSISRLPLLSPTELRQLLLASNSSSATFPQDLCVHNLFEARAEKEPDRCAVSFADLSLSYRDLNERANQLAHYLVSQGISQGSLVAICMERSASMLVATLATLKAGAAYVPLDPSFPQQRLRFMLEDSRAPMLLTEEHLSELLSPTDSSPDPSAFSGALLCLDRDWPLVAQHSTLNPTGLAHPQAPAYVIYTSGSTGQPKGVVVPHRSVTNFICSMQQRPGLVREDTLLAVTTLSFDIAGLELYLPLSMGAKVHLASREEAADPVQLLKLLTESGATVMQATPAMWRMLIEVGWQGTPKLRMLCGGEALSGELARQLRERGAQLWNMYGPTETTIWSTVEEVGESTPAIVSLGRAIANTSCYVLSRWWEVVPQGVVGELYIGGEGLAQSYLGRAELTAERFIPDGLSGEPGARLYRTGDLVRSDAEGKLEYMGRADQQVKVRGYRIEVGEVEAALLKHERVREAVVLAREDGSGEKRLVGYVLREASEDETSELNAGEMREHLRQLIPEYMIPTVFVEMTEMPLTPNGKVDRKRLPQVEAQSRARREDKREKSETEQMLEGIWREVLKVEAVGLEESFFELGGHSLLATQVISRVRETFKIEIPLRLLFKTPTIAGLALAIAERSGEQQYVPADVIQKITGTDEKLLTNLDELSDQEVDSLLSEMLTEAELNQ